MRNRAWFLVLYVITAPAIFSLSINIRSFDHDTYTRVVLEGSEGFEYKYNASKTYVEVKLTQKAEVGIDPNRKDSVLIERMTHYQEEGRSVFRVLLKSEFKITRNFVLERPFRVVFDLTGSNPAGSAVLPAKEEGAPQDLKKEPKEGTQPPVDPGEKKEPEAIRTICIDPGHGGSDLGAVSRSNLLEKDVTLKVSKKLKGLIESKLGLHVVMTRESDEELSLNSRVAKANNQKAQIFISLHVNSSFRKAASGPETYYVSLKATDQEAFQLSQKENSASQEEVDKLTGDDKLKMILWDMAQNEYIKDSARLADFIQDELNIIMHTRNRGVKQAPFRVLMRAAMPAVLVEIAFISNYSEEKNLNDNAFLDKAAASLYTGIKNYIYYHNDLYR